MPEPSVFEVDFAIENPKSRISPALDQIPGELIKAGSRTICYEVHKLINSIWIKEELPDDLKEPIIVPIYKKCDKQDCSNFRGVCLSSVKYIQNFIQNFVVKVNSICRGNYWGFSM